MDALLGGFCKKGRERGQWENTFDRMVDATSYWKEGGNAEKTKKKQERGKPG